ncbi:hypothetical protein [Jiangella anatolica]|uniref:Uncharacterized protein n=1 Tax=Jiangella anatolica TaxID=2670374 RepID=A0A2W2BLI9_9ACTN|nr:hypothetical protein [Jiangella anatolica]PZF81148.1 hypothetical protein C1I92_22510 [Jiangella anatolica]
MSDDPVGVLTRWEDAGGEWRVVARTAGAVTVALCRCDGGEEVDRFTSADPALLEFLAGRG